MFCAWAEYFEALLRGAPLQNVNVDIARPPAFHLQLRRLIKIDRTGADKRRPVIVDDKFLPRTTDSKASPERETRPIGGRAHNVTAG